MLEEPHLYRKISEKIRQEILDGQWEAGERLPTLRDMAGQWNCTIGTIQHAYRELARQGLVTSRPGQGTRVTENLPVINDTPMRRAQLIHRAEAFLLEVLTGGYRLDEIDQAVREAMERWRLVEQHDSPRDEKILLFAGSHDLVITWLASHFPEISPGYSLQPKFSGSMGGLIALAEGKADLAGCHLWDEESEVYNAPFVRRLLPGKRTALVRLANRRLGLILAPGNPKNINSLTDLTQPGLRFINRQSGSGTRVWLDISLRNLGIDSTQITGYQNEKITHFAIAQEIAEDKADTGIGLEGAAMSYGLDFLFLAHEHYDLIIPELAVEASPMADLLNWLKTSEARQVIESLGGYETASTGQIEWVG